jgi:tRNA wybutosine-synthesizing protein 3
MNFENQKKTFLTKLDKSKKGSIDRRVNKLITLINRLDDYYTTSSCSGRTYLWRGEVKNQVEWLKITHDLLPNDFFNLEDFQGLIWLRLEGLILHIACRDITAANRLLQEARRIYKKSSILSISKKIIVEIRDSENIEMPFYQNLELIFSGDLEFLREMLNEKMQKIWKKRNEFYRLLETSKAKAISKASTMRITNPPSNRR